MTPDNVSAVLTYWFGEQDPPTEVYRKRWFTGGEIVDTEIKTRFADLHAAVSKGRPESDFANAQTLLAAIIVIDQFSRNLYRGSAQAFAWDTMAQQWSLSGWEQGIFTSLTASQQAFAMMPLMHSEALTLHERGLAILEALNNIQPETDTIITGFYSSAQEHHDIIAQFGRFPHRNKVLGRESTIAEVAYLNDGAKRFGQ